MAPHAEDYRHLDMAAAQVATVLREAGIDHMFCGGYAASCVGSERITKNINVVLERDADEAFIGLPEFKWSRADSCWVFEYGDSTVRIITHLPESKGWAIPRARNAKKLSIRPSDLPDRQLGAKIHILHPSVLFYCKLGAWNAAEDSNGPLSLVKARGHLKDILAILRWLGKERYLLNLSQVPGDFKRQTVLTQLFHLYTTKTETRIPIVSVTSWRDLRDVLNSEE